MPGLSDTTIAGDDAPARASFTPTRIERGAQVGRYVVLHPLGRGGMGVVYAAFDPQLDRKVALKLLHAQPSQGTDATDGGSRLLREAQALAKLAHPNVITIHDVGTVDGAVFLAMEFIEGQTLGDWVEAEVGRPWREVITMFASAGRGIAAAHGASIVHRDFKPDNVMIGKDGRPRVLDFGLARAAGLGELVTSDDRRSTSSSLDTKLTMTGAVMGTPAYMAPEQHLGGTVDERSDQFSFCVAVYEALHGERPFGGDSLASLTFAVTQGKVRDPPATSAVPGWLRKVLLRGLAREPSERYPSMDELLRELDRDPTRTRRIAIAGVGLVALLVGLGIGGQRLLAEPQLCRGAEQHLVGVWDPDTRAAVHEAFAASHAVYAEAAFRGFSATLDHYAAEWTTMHGEACEATRIRGEQSDEVLSLRMACLDRSRSQLSALVEVYRDPDAKTLERSVEAAESLPPLRLCADVEQLMLGVRPPETAAQREQVDELRVEVDKARSLGQAARTIAARELLVALMPKVDAVGYRPLIAEAELARGTALETPDQQIVALERAVWMAEVSRHDRVAAEAWILLVKVYGVGANDFERALDAVARADAAIERIGADPDLKIQLDVAHGMVSTSMSRHEQAVELHQKARQARVAAGQGGTPVALNEVVALANALFELNRSQDAGRVLSEALDQAEPLLGHDHPWVARLRATQARALYAVEDYAGAEASLRTALAVFEQANGKDSPQVASVLNGLALVLSQQRHFDEALPIYQRALTNFRTNNGPRHVNVGRTLINIGVLQREAGDFEDALISLEQGLAIKREVYGSDVYDIGLAQDDVCRALHGLGRNEEAAMRCRIAVEVLERLPEPKHGALIDAWTSLAMAERALGHTDVARDLLDRADARINALGGSGVDASTLGRHYFEHAKLRAAIGEQAEARTLAERALARYSAASDYYQPRRDDVRAWLAAPASPAP